MLITAPPKNFYTSPFVLSFVNKFSNQELDTCSKKLANEAILFFIKNLIQINTSKRRYIAIGAPGKYTEDSLQKYQPHIEVPLHVWDTEDEMFPEKLSLILEALHSDTFLLGEVLAMKRVLFHNRSSYFQGLLNFLDAYQPSIIKYKKNLLGISRKNNIDLKDIKQQEFSTEDISLFIKKLEYWNASFAKPEIETTTYVSVTTFFCLDKLKESIMLPVISLLGNPHTQFLKERNLEHPLTSLYEVMQLRSLLLDNNIKLRPLRYIPIEKPLPAVQFKLLPEGQKPSISAAIKFVEVSKTSDQAWNCLVKWAKQNEAALLVNKDKYIKSFPTTSNEITIDVLPKIIIDKEPRAITLTSIS